MGQLYGTDVLNNLNNLQCFNLEDLMLHLEMAV